MKLNWKINGISIQFQFKDYLAFKPKETISKINHLYLCKTFQFFFFLFYILQKINWFLNWIEADYPISHHHHQHYHSIWKFESISNATNFINQFARKKKKKRYSLQLNRQQAKFLNYQQHFTEERNINYK